MLRELVNAILIEVCLSTWLIYNLPAGDGPALFTCAAFTRSVDQFQSLATQIGSNKLSELVHVLGFAEQVKREASRV
jgi:hypothetical protein